MLFHFPQIYCAGLGTEPVPSDICSKVLVPLSIIISGKQVALR